jgi:ubiquinone/menaquinone biosynthesis C-methylase UbiE
MAVADIGTGTGYLLPHLSPAAGAEGRVFAVDISPAMLEWVEERAKREGMNNVTTVIASGGATGLPPSTVDRAIMVNVWHHIEDPDAYARDLHRVMREGAILFIVEAHPGADHRGSPPRHFRLPPETVVEQLERAGFRAKLDPFQIDRQYVVRAER